MANREKVVGFYQSTANRILNRLGSGSEGSFTEWQRGRGGGSVMRMFLTPSGGIPAAVGTVPGSAVCTELPAGMGGSAGSSVAVKNHRTSIIPGSVYILAMDFLGEPYCIEGNCPGSVLPPEEEP
jgi:hypothetical protein